MATRVRIRIIEVESIENPVRFFASYSNGYIFIKILVCSSRCIYVSRDWNATSKYTVGFFVIKTRSDSLSLSKLDKVDNRYSFLSLFGQKKSVPREFINWIQTVRYFKLATYIIN